MVLSYGIEAAAGTDAGASGTRNSACALFRASEPASACKRERALQGRFPPAPLTTKPQPFSVGVLSCLSAPDPACSWGFREQTVRTVIDDDLAANGLQAH